MKAILCINGEKFKDIEVSNVCKYFCISLEGNDNTYFALMFEKSDKVYDCGILHFNLVNIGCDKIAYADYQEKCHKEEMKNEFIDNIKRYDEAFVLAQIYNLLFEIKELLVNKKVKK